MHATSFLRNENGNQRQVGGERVRESLTNRMRKDSQVGRRIIIENVLKFERRGKGKYKRCQGGDEVVG